VAASGGCGAIVIPAAIDVATMRGAHAAARRRLLGAAAAEPAEPRSRAVGRAARTVCRATVVDGRCGAVGARLNDCMCAAVLQSVGAARQHEDHRASLVTACTIAYHRTSLAVVPSVTLPQAVCVKVMPADSVRAVAVWDQT